MSVFKRVRGALLSVVSAIIISVMPAYADSYDVPQVHPNARVIYVSSSLGNDNNNGLSPQTPKKTIASAKNLLRDKQADRLLLKEGDTFYENFGTWSKSGLDLRNPMLISYYRDSNATGPVDRPKLLTGTNTGLMVLNNPVKNLMIHGLYFKAHTYTGNSEVAAIVLLDNTENITLTYNYITNYTTGFISSPYPSGTVRKQTVLYRNTFDTNYIIGNITNGHSIYASGCDDLKLLQNILYRSGWNPSNPETNNVMYQFRHGWYLQSSNDGLPTGGNCSRVLARGNIIFHSASDNQMRGGGSLINNLFIQNPMAHHFGGGNDVVNGGVDIVAKNNVITEGIDMAPGHDRGWGFTFKNVRSASVTGNIFTGNAGNFPVGINTSYNSQGIGVHDASFIDNVIHNWKDGFFVQGTPQQMQDLSFLDNRVSHIGSTSPTFRFDQPSVMSEVTGSGNTAINGNNGGNNVSVAGTMTNLSALGLGSTNMPAYPDSGRTIGKYMESIGFSSAQQNSDAFMAEVLKQAPEGWDDRFTALPVINYFREGFAMPALGQN